MFFPLITDAGVSLALESH